MIKTNYYTNNCDNLTRFINQMSNPNINGRCGNVYIGTNEEGRQKTFDSLANSLPSATSCHIGFSSWFNFDIIFKKKSSRAILIDFNPDTKSFLKETLNALIISSTRNEFANKISQYITQNKGKFAYNINEEIEYSTRPEEDVFVEQTIPDNWLNSDEGFNYIKKLAKEGKIAIITENICSDEKMKRIASVIRENGYVVDTLYVSNISKYMYTEEDRGFYLRSINYLSGPETKIIHVPGRGFLSDLKQEVIDVNKIPEKDSGREPKIEMNLLFPDLETRPFLHKTQDNNPSASKSDSVRQVFAAIGKPSNSRNENARLFRTVALVMVAGALLYLQARSYF